LKSSSGHYFIALDHVRALAAWLVFTWHFVHGQNGSLTPFEFSPIVFVFSVFNEGHTGVALFMTLSGYLFAKLLHDRKIRYGDFLWNRFLRLAPLLIFVIAIEGVHAYSNGFPLATYLSGVAQGLILPILPKGGWSITVEFHFYLVLPILLWLSRKSAYGLLAIVALMIVLRSVLFAEHGSIHTLAYKTIVGRLDQFILGIIAFQYCAVVRGRTWPVLAVAVFFLMLVWWFDIRGGFYNFPTYPSTGAHWVVLTTVEGLAYGTLIAWYDNSFDHPSGRFSQFVARIGTYSYSIYLLHLFVVFEFANFINVHLFPLTNFYLALLGSTIGFLLMVPIGHLSYRYIESPFLRLRTPYVVEPSVPKPNSG
jgi:peptidoglycan/LPS O-acetylase OafA/YrhL